MKEFVNKLIGRLEEYPHGKYEDEYGKGFSAGINASIEEVNELAEEHNNGWIACSERLPKEYDIVLLCTKDNMVSQGRRFDYFGHNRYELDGKFFILWDEDIVAWQPLPKPYKEGE